jgi:hypothetical protein
MQSFEAKGLWWLPQYPTHQVAGTLSFDPSSGATLSTIGDVFANEIAQLFGTKKEFGSISWFPEKISIPCIHGYIDAGDPITLWRNRWDAETMATGYLGSKFVSQVLFKGCHFDKEEDIVFSEVSIDYSLLEQWLGPEGLSGKFTDHEDGRPHRIEYTYEFSPPVSYSVNKLTVSFHHDLKLEGDRVADIHLIRNSSIRVQCKQPMDFGELQRDVIYHLRNLLTLATGSSVVPERVRAFSPNTPIETPSGLPTQIEMYYITKSGEPTPRPLNRRDMLFRYEDVRDNFELYLGNWIIKSEQLRPVIDLYFSLFYIPSMYVHLEFLTLAQAIETYHRRVYVGEYVPSDEAAPIIDALSQAIPENVSSDHKQSIKQRLKYLNEFSLRKRLKNILNDALSPYQSIVDQLIINRGDFVENVVETRNYLTHYSGEPRDNPAEQRVLARKLRVLMQLCFCKEIGFPAETVVTLMSQHRDFLNWRF